MPRLKTWFYRNLSSNWCSKGFSQNKTSKLLSSRGSTLRKKVPISSRWSHNFTTSLMSCTSSHWPRLLPKARTRRWLKMRWSIAFQSDGLKDSTSTMSSAWTSLEVSQSLRNAVISIAIRSSTSVMSMSRDGSSLWLIKWVARHRSRTRSSTIASQVRMSITTVLGVCPQRWCMLQWLKSNPMLLTLPSKFSSVIKHSQMWELLALKLKVANPPKLQAWLMEVKMCILTRRLNLVTLVENLQPMLNLKVSYSTTPVGSQTLSVLSTNMTGQRSRTCSIKVRSLRSWLQSQILLSTTIYLSG